jgi:hypothetical protein
MTSIASDSVMIKLKMPLNNSEHSPNNSEVSPTKKARKVSKCKKCNCPDCNDKEKLHQNLLSEIAKISERLKILEKTTMKDNTAQLTSIIKQQTESTQDKFQARLHTVEKTISSNAVNAKDNSIHEVEERKRRETNFVVYGLPESNNLEPKQRCEDDKVILSETLRKSGIQIHQNEFLSVFRAGKKLMIKTDLLSSNSPTNAKEMK